MEAFTKGVIHFGLSITETANLFVNPPKAKKKPMPNICLKKEKVRFQTASCQVRDLIRHGRTLANRLKLV